MGGGWGDDWGGEGWLAAVVVMTVVMGAEVNGAGWRDQES